MGVRIGRHTAERIAAAGRSFALQVQNASDLGAAISALKLARVDIVGLIGGQGGPAGREASPAVDRPSVSPVVNAPGGPLLLVEHLEAGADIRAAIPEVVARRLERTSIESATIEAPAVGGALDALDTVPHAVVLRLFPVPRGAATALPPDWLDIAAEWVAGDGDSEPIGVRILGVEFEVDSMDLSAVVHECGLARAWCDAVIGMLHDRVRTASLTFGRLPHLALAAGGPHVDNAGLLARFDLLQELARELAADVAYACVDFEPTFEGLATGLSPAGWQSQGGASPNLVARELVDERVPDAFPYQIIGPGHLARMGASGLPGEPLGNGRFEVIFDQPRTWLVTNPDRDDAQAAAWQTLAPLLVTDDEAGDLVAARAARGEQTAPAVIEEADLAGLDAVPDLDAIVLERHAHPRRGTRLSLLELASWLSHAPHSDTPECVAPVLATYARWLAAGLDDDTRQSLKWSAPRLIGTAPASDEQEDQRRWLAVDQLVRVQARAWLAAAGMHEAADRLGALGPLTAHLDLVRAVDILGNAITVASRRLDITASIVTDDEGLDADDRLVWAAWERVSEATGWVAASEAGTHGAPPELTYATDLRVIECSRDARVRDELEQARKSIGDTAWTTALHAVADEAWERAWRAADLAARELSGFTVRVEMGRIAKSRIASEGFGEDDDPEAALDAAERAARDSLTRAVLSGGAPDDGEHPWDAARNAARLSAGGKQWSIISDEARRAVGEDAWAQAMADARAEVSALLDGAPETVARVVVAAVAREASSVAARSVALRAASVARANGGDDDAAARAANDALEAVARDLVKEAILLLDRLIDPGAAHSSPPAAPASHPEVHLTERQVVVTEHHHLPS